MKIEHIAYNVAEPNAMAQWYCEHLGMTVARNVGGPIEMQFLRDSGSSLIEIYRNPADQVPDYRSMDPLLLHLAFTSEDPDADATRLVAAGAELLENRKLPDGTHLCMLRDPWGFAVQLCKRAAPMV